jgi:hypothetical protein
VTYFWTDADLDSKGEFVEESAVDVALEFTPAKDGVIKSQRAHFPAVAGTTPIARLFKNDGTSLMNQAYDTTVADAWNTATPPGGDIPVLGGTTYRVGFVSTRYHAKLGFFSGGSVVRGDITGVGGRFSVGNVFPSTSSAAGFLVDIDYVPTDSGLVQALPTVIDLSSAGTFGRQKSRALPTAVETDASGILGRSKSRVLPVALELDVAKELGGAAPVLPPGVGARQYTGNRLGRTVQSTPRGRRA